MLFKLTLAAVGALLAVESQAAFTTGFGDAPGDASYQEFDGSNVADLGGQDGWQINDEAPLISFVTTRDGSQAGGLGGLFNEAGEAVATVRHKIGVPLAFSVFSVDFTVNSSQNFPGQDTFGFSFSDDSAAPIFSLSLEPQTVQTNLLNVHSSVSGGSSNPSGYAILTGGTYSLSISFTPSGSDDISFFVSLSGTNDTSFAGIIPNAGTSSIRSAGVFYEVVDNSDSFIAFDNFSVIPVPEPSSLIFLGAGTVGFALRRRRK